MGLEGATSNSVVVQDAGPGLDEQSPLLQGLAKAGAPEQVDEWKKPRFFIFIQTGE